MRALIKYVEQGGVLETHDDISDSLRKQLYAEDNQRLEMKKSPDNSLTGSVCPPINIIVLPAPVSQSSMPTPSATRGTPPKSDHVDPIKVHGLLDIAVEEYTDWQQSRVSSETFRDNIKNARDVALENCFDLMQIYEDQDPGFFVEHGVKVGVARRFVRDIGLWVKGRGEINVLKGNNDFS